MDKLKFKELVYKYAEGNYYDEKHEDFEKIKDALFNNGVETYVYELFGETWGGVFKTIWNKSSEYTYSVGYYRRPFRTKVNAKLYLYTYTNKLIELANLLKNDFTIEKYLSNTSENKYYGSIISDIIAYEIDNNNENVMEKIKDIIYGDNQNGFLTRPIIKGLLMSKKEECYKMVGDLLLAAKLQEGLRQSILESVDETCVESFKYMLKVIMDNDLLRFSSVIRSVGVWTGLNLEAEKPSLVKKVFGTIYNSLFDDEYKIRSVNSNDTIEIYGALWAEGFIEINNAKILIKELLDSNVKYKRLTALYFLSNIQDDLFQYELAKDLLNEKDLEIVAWANLNIKSNLNIKKDEFDLLFNSYKSIVENIKKETSFKPSVFPWCEISLKKEDLLHKMLSIAKDSKDDNKLDDLSNFMNFMSTWTRRNYVEAISKPNTKKQRDTLILSISDKSDAVRSKAFEESLKLDLTKDEYRKMEDYLRFKSGDLRKGLISLLIKQDSDSLYETIERLVNDKLEEKKLASLDMIYEIKDKDHYKETYKKSLNLINTMKAPSEKMTIIIDKILDKNEEPCIVNGFMLYDHNDELNLPMDNMNFSINIPIEVSMERIKEIFQKLSDLIHENRDYEYEIECYDGTKRKVILGAENYLHPISKKIKNNELTIDDYPLKDIWVKFSNDLSLNPHELLFIQFICNSEFNDSYNYYKSREAKWYVDFKNEVYDLNKFKEIYKSVYEIKYVSIINLILRLLKELFPEEIMFNYVKDMALYTYSKIPKEYFTKPIYEESKNGYLNDYCIGTQHMFNFWIYEMKQYIYDDESFKDFFTIKYNFYKNAEYKSINMEFKDFKRAFDLGLVNKNEIYKELMERPSSPNNIATLTNSKLSEYLNNHFIKEEIVPKVINKVIEIEIKRGDLQTEVSGLACKINYFEGMDYFVNMLLAFGSDTFARGYFWSIGNKKNMLSHLIKSCYPREGDGAFKLKSLLKGKYLPDSKIIDAAMYAPQWISIVEEYLGWKGLSQACWYFHAHVNEGFSSLKETNVARYSPITPQEFRDGAFDINWFKLAYKTLGEKKFSLVYDSAKYITAGGSHKRAQLFSDAVLKKLDINEVEERICKKRNKDYMLAYSLMPLKNKKKDILKRYEFIQNFLKESKNFGAQRRESEGKVCAIALDNLARNAGFENVTRFTWAMESEKIKELKGFLSPKKIGEFFAYVHVDEDGNSKLKVLKGEKELKAVPTALKKDLYIEELKTVQKNLKDQLIRSRKAFEKAMEGSEEFKSEEIKNILLNPVLAPMVKKIVFKCGDHLGYFNDDKLIGLGGIEHALSSSDNIIIAHPYDLYESKIWSDFQKDIFNRQIIQPFKQVFRELYLINEDEKSEGTISRRYAGFQVQPRKTIALLRSRGWTVHYEEGLQRVYYKENIIAKVYAKADWFSPSDVESPTLEAVRFYERGSYKSLKLEDIPKKIFSEVMRDVDLVVSVAHVGGVDPEASLSTIELRGVIVEEILRLMKIKNVNIKGSHAHINGTLGEFTVHLGSSVVHKMGRGAINILTVQSQHRGRLFLPFIDEDPRTQEVVSKVVLLAEDFNIKDPSILDQVNY